MTTLSVQFEARNRWLFRLSVKDPVTAFPQSYLLNSIFNLGLSAFWRDGALCMYLCKITQQFLVNMMNSYPYQLPLVSQVTIQPQLNSGLTVIHKCRVWLANSPLMATIKEKTRDNFGYFHRCTSCRVWRRNTFSCSVLLSISFPESSGLLVSGWSLGEISSGLILWHTEKNLFSHSTLGLLRSPIYLASIPHSGVCWQAKMFRRLVLFHTWTS